jgi:hypothetical protein
MLMLVQPDASGLALIFIVKPSA